MTNLINKEKRFEVYHNIHHDCVSVFIKTNHQFNFFNFYWSEAQLFFYNKEYIQINIIHSRYQPIKMTFLYADPAFDIEEISKKIIELMN